MLQLIITKHQYSSSTSPKRMCPFCTLFSRCSLVASAVAIRFKERKIASSGTIIKALLTKASEWIRISRLGADGYSAFSHAILAMTKARQFISLAPHRAIQRLRHGWRKKKKKPGFCNGRIPVSTPTSNLRALNFRRVRWLRKSV